MFKTDTGRCTAEDTGLSTVQPSPPPPHPPPPPRRSTHGCRHSRSCTSPGTRSFRERERLRKKHRVPPPMYHPPVTPTATARSYSVYGVWRRRNAFLPEHSLNTSLNTSFLYDGATSEMTAVALLSCPRFQYPDTLPWPFPQTSLITSTTHHPHHTHTHAHTHAHIHTYNEEEPSQAQPF